MHLTENAIYILQGKLHRASYLAGTWVLMPLDAAGGFGNKRPGELAAYRCVDGQWLEMLVTATPTGEELVYGAVVEVDLARLIEVVAGQDAALDEEFASIMAPVTWEWTN